jgi:hypothetical protein
LQDIKKNGSPEDLAALRKYNHSKLQMRMRPGRTTWTFLCK